MRYIQATLCVMLVLLLGACTEELLNETPPTPFEKGLEEVSLSLRCLPAETIGDEWSASPDTRAADASIKDNLISNIWVFQYNSAGNQITAPHYYTLPANTTASANVSVMLRPATNCTVYIIANTNSNTWFNGVDVSTLAKLEAVTHTFATEDEVYGGTNKNLLMSGSSGSLTINAGESNALGTISLKRMLAMITFKYKFATADLGKKLKVTRITLNSVPNMLKVGASTGTYPPTVDTPLEYSVITSPVDETYYTAYVPENLRGTTSNTDEKNKNKDAPAGAICIKLYIDSEVDGGSYVYTVYPGENNKNDFNIKRNYKYTLTLNLKSSVTDSRVMAAPANCFVMKRNASIAFDPYERTETGGGWRYADYVDKTVANKKFSRVEILWQTGDGTNFAIGNNASGSRVYLKDDIVYVTAGNTDGNAVIAGYNSSGVILWSWHIWVNDSSPAQVANAVPYTTYEWDTNGIHSEKRVEGRPVMSCNLGALSNTEVGAKAYGLLYQWGRKDPFPQGKIDYFNGDGYDPYSSELVVPVYDNRTALIAMNKTPNVSEVFQSVMVSAANGNIDYTLKHPTYFIKTSEVYSTDDQSVFINEGDWYWGHNDQLWGGKPLSEATKIYETDTPHYLLLANNGADRKSLFDPCPSGWMLAPGDMWLGFTKTGFNTSDNTYQLINCSEKTTTENSNNFGYHIYMKGWKTGQVAYFPSQGVRLPSGNLQRFGICGNYHTSTSGKNGTVYILHLHTVAQINIFETMYLYTRRSVGGPIRCVRETK